MASKGILRQDKHEIHPLAGKTLIEAPIIAAVNDPSAFEVALESPPRAVYLLTGNPLSLPAMLRRAAERGKQCLVNIDFLDGLARDKFAVEFLASHDVAGIVSTRFEILKAARSFGLITIQRTFSLDTAAVAATVRSLSQFLPDAVEVLPAMAAPKVSRRLLKDHPGLRIIGGGLIETVREIEDLLAAGIDAVSVSDQRLWLI
ncbi:glycerol-3-phosphate responsive antiterminator [Edaphobacter sp. 12200R-103]|uniref:glycerol-3-phosphate responsive antiterminator n=1 Tax=Edaphobacter sp. 12200R-103 TaxID=2703788 RepID=UPI00138CB1E7|nr:glycerol-3-phosphate responsive antiterminator [Edaphobacter sp. 12200R-103]QHS53086.1 glycerol-3-phosphate responsive antiterminator [Edaphobacter sp. 12200R-103]